MAKLIGWLIVTSPFIILLGVIWRQTGLENLISLLCYVSFIVVFAIIFLVLFLVGIYLIERR
jgi:hypothetical protein